MWNQRSRVCWIEWGDRNTKFFHATASQRRRKNKIRGLLNSDGEWQEGQEEIDGIVLDYFASIYKSYQASCFEASLNAINAQVTQDMNVELLAEFKAEEVWRALNQMHPTKSPRPNGMSLIFYQKHWDVVFWFMCYILCLRCLNNCTMQGYK